MMQIEEKIMVTFDTIEEAAAFGECMEDRTSKPFSRVVAKKPTFLLERYQGQYARTYNEETYLSKPENFESQAHYVAHKLSKEVMRLGGGGCHGVGTQDGEVVLYTENPAAFRHYEGETEGVTVRVEKRGQAVAGPYFPRRRP